MKYARAALATSVIILLTVISCRMSRPVDRPCGAQDRCFHGEECLDGRCYPCTLYACDTGNRCPGSYKCNNGCCLPAGDGGSPWPDGGSVWPDGGAPPADGGAPWPDGGQADGGLKMNGEICQSESECASGYCEGANTIEKYCCNRLCPWPCESCAYGSCSPSMTFISSGIFTMGDDNLTSREKPPHQVELSTFLIGTCEVTQAAFAECVAAQFCSLTNFQTKSNSATCNFGYTNRTTHPMNCVNWYGARQYCQYLGGDLPTEAQWERVARGGAQLDYAWGQLSPTCDRAVLNANGGPGCNMQSTWPVGSKAAGNTSNDIMDLTGNVYEWVRDCKYDYPGGGGHGS